jgi:hypothetical protein
MPGTSNAKTKDINFLTALTAAEEGRHRAKKGVNALIVLFAFVAMASGGFFVWNQMQQGSLIAEKTALESYLNDQQVAAQYAQSEQTRNEAAGLDAKAKALEGAVSGVATHPDLSAGQIRQTFSIAGESVELNDFVYDRETGQLAFSATCEKATGVSAFISQLRMSGIFADVAYEGYTGNTTSVTGAGIANEDGSTTYPATVSTSFTFNVRCSVAAPGSSAATDATATEDAAAEDAAAEGAAADAAATEDAATEDAAAEGARDTASGAGEAGNG